MPNFTVSLTTTQATRALAAIRARVDPKDIQGMTDTQVGEYYVKRVVSDLVTAHEKDTAAKAISVAPF